MGVWTGRRVARRTVREVWRCCFFFFSSRRRHTRLQGDWSSDVCSSDLKLEPGHTAVWSRARGLSIQQYWDLPRDCEPAPRDVEARIVDWLDESVRAQDRKSVV